tara:strand:+ start:7520 stop:7936 length:417 start_codon:yes stop_codon:yes gene_type:complete
MALRRIVYTSQASEKFSKRSLLDLLHESRAFNAIDNISGVLMHKNGYFLQVIEGNSEVIDNLFKRLLKDSRHKKIKKVLDSTVNSCLFLNWAMGCADFDDPELSFIPGIRTDLSDPTVIESIIIKLPEIAFFFLENRD